MTEKTNRERARAVTERLERLLEQIEADIKGRPPVGRTHLGRITRNPKQESAA